MILYRYLFFTILKKQILILLATSVVLFFQQFLKISNISYIDTIPIDTIFYVITLNFPKILQFILPFSLFMSVLFSINLMFCKNEIFAFYNLGYKKKNYFSFYLH
ncbi:LptF/LptG family permease [bacterium endosymbiont of Pedicinus badii]|uniref:LptF/LptG family permease n=1 Tax=bacterium endosymbiont of Pedicinus badii TaxID=1719126 RepID=UPI0009B9E0F6|nr:LptF/LptG family permease [bacterium endosymbiont of Pedicinus badii]OQM34139.1 hypothetical protein AOQ89_02240 [bacterium endosymbiont of Pedicinus badii]